jgi:hypothetical protein
MHVIQTLLLVLSTVCVVRAVDDLAAHRFRGHVSKFDGKYQVITSLADVYVEPKDEKGTVLANGFWDQTYNITGWSVLEIRTFDNQSNIDQAYSAGLLEGQLTRGLFSSRGDSQHSPLTLDITEWQRQNNIDDICRDKAALCQSYKSFFDIQLDWIYTQIDKYPDDEYWHQVHLLLVQLNGLTDGHQNNSRGPRKEIADPLDFL